MTTAALQSEQKSDQADNTQQQEPGIRAQACEVAQPAGNGRTQYSRRKRCRHRGPLAESEQPIVPGIGHIRGAW